MQAENEVREAKDTISPRDTKNNQFNFLLEAYKSRVEYFNGLSERVSNRFNILLAVNITMGAFFGAALISDQPVANEVLWVVAIIGFVFALLLYVQSAQDKYLTKKHIEKVNELRELIEHEINRSNIPALFVPLDKTDTGEKSWIFIKPTSWRSNLLSLTSIPPITGLLLMIVWVIVFLWAIL